MLKQWFIAQMPLSSFLCIWNNITFTVMSQAQCFKEIKRALRSIYLQQCNNYIGSFPYTINGVNYHFLEIVCPVLIKQKDYCGRFISS